MVYFIGALWVGSVAGGLLAGAETGAGVIEISAIERGAVGTRFHAVTSAERDGGVHQSPMWHSRTPRTISTSEVKRGERDFDLGRAMGVIYFALNFSHEQLKTPITENCLTQDKLHVHSRHT